jgi:hypothetical protein
MTKTPKWQPDGSGIDPKSLDVGTVVEWDGQVSHPPSQAVIEAVEQAFRVHVVQGLGWKCTCGVNVEDFAGYERHSYTEVARAAEAAALRVAADECEANARDWYGTDIFRDVDSADLAAVRSAMQAKGKDIDNLSAWYFRRALTMRADILRRTADELTDETGEQ